MWSPVMSQLERGTDTTEAGGERDHSEKNLSISQTDQTVESRHFPLSVHLRNLALFTFAHKL